jgi:hypothetical protein
MLVSSVADEDNRRPGQHTLPKVAADERGEVMADIRRPNILVISGDDAGTTTH